LSGIYFPKGGQGARLDFLRKKKDFGKKSFGKKNYLCVRFFSKKSFYQRYSDLMAKQFYQYRNKQQTQQEPGTVQQQVQGPQGDDTLVDIVEVKGKFEHFTEQYGKFIYGGLIALAVIVVGYFAYSKLIQAPKELAASEALLGVQEQFAVDSFQNVLDGTVKTIPGADGASTTETVMGALEIINQYGGTDAGNLARFYAGVAYLKLGQFNEAIQQLEDFDAGSSSLQASAYSALGDAYSENGDFDNGLQHYKKACDLPANDFYTPMNLYKAGLLSEKQGNRAEAKAFYERIKREFPMAPISAQIDAYIARVSE
jgi:tetratricopeptide (TPR) repeat protein